MRKSNILSRNESKWESKSSYFSHPIGVRSSSSTSEKSPVSWKSPEKRSSSAVAIGCQESDLRQKKCPLFEKKMSISSSSILLTIQARVSQISQKRISTSYQYSYDPRGDGVTRKSHNLSIKIRHLYRVETESSELRRPEW